MDSFLQDAVLILTGLASLLVIGGAIFSFVRFIHKRVREWRARRERERVEWERVEEKRRSARMALREKERARREQMEGLKVRRIHPYFESAILAALRKREGRATEEEIYETLPTLEPRLIYLCLSGMFQTGFVEIKGEEALFLTEKGKRRYHDLTAREGDDVRDMQDEAREVLRAEFSNKRTFDKISHAVQFDEDWEVVAGRMRREWIDDVLAGELGDRLCELICAAQHIRDDTGRTGAFLYTASLIGKAFFMDTLPQEGRVWHAQRSAIHYLETQCAWQFP